MRMANGAGGSPKSVPVTSSSPSALRIGVSLRSTIDRGESSSHSAWTSSGLRKSMASVSVCTTR